MSDSPVLHLFPIHQQIRNVRLYVSSYYVVSKSIGSGRSMFFHSPPVSQER